MPITMRLPESDLHPFVGDVVRSWAAVVSTEFSVRGRLLIREREDRAREEARLAAEAAAQVAVTSTVPGPASSTTTTTTTTIPEPPPPPPELVVDYQPAEHRDRWSVVRMVASTTLDGPPEVATRAFYVSDAGEVISSRGVVAPDRQADLMVLVSGLLTGRATDWSGIAPETILADVTLGADGAIVVRVPTRFLVEGADPSPVVIAADVADPMLGSIGRAVMAGQALGSGDAVDCTVTACVALTFDDGPTATTVELLDMFGRSGDVATFFVLGPLVERRPEIALRIVDEGHEIGNHAWSHRSLARLPVDTALDELVRTDAAIEAATGVTPELMRPPYGQYDLDVRYLGYPLALWDVDTQDWRYRDPSETVRRTLQSVRPGSVVVMHDIHESTLEAVPLLVAELRASGYTLVTMSALTGEAEAGAVYFSQTRFDEPPPPTTTTTTTTLPVTSG